MKNWIILFSLLCIACGNNVTKENTEFQLEVGDILFQDLDSSPLCDAIELVTPGFKNGNFSHIGIVVETLDVLYINPDKICNKDNPENYLRVLEAIPEKVTTTRIDTFLMRSSDNNNNPKVIVGRLKNEYKNTIPKAIEFANKQIGVDYDDVFILDNNKYYCSELIYEAFLKDSIFRLNPMTFLDPKSGDTLQTWIDYYSDLGVEIPENKLGINPGIMSLSDKIEIIHFYGIPDGMKR
tara:strand:- start:194 stop:907 length:714 start_codon:yes stop_codon:yes gene_type:complete